MTQIAIANNHLLNNGAGGVELAGHAFGAPGICPRWTSSAKEGVGTAYSDSSRVWFTLSHGILNEVYYPTIDRPQVRDMEFLISDGETFLHEEKRDLDDEIEFLDQDVMAYRLTTSDPQDRYRLVKEVIAAPHLACVLIRTRLEGQEEWLRRLHLYALVAPHLEVGGADNNARRMLVAGKEILLAWKGRTAMAMGSSAPFVGSSCGYVGASDGWTDLRMHKRMAWRFDSATEGNLALTAEIDLTGGREFTLALAFGFTNHAAVNCLMSALSVPYGKHKEKFIQQWRRLRDDIYPLERHSCDGGFLYGVSRRVLLTHEDKLYPGALIASASIPWGQYRSDDDIGGYHRVWTRDMVQSATGLLAAGDKVTPQRALVYLACSQQADGGFAQNFWIDGRPVQQGIQLDQVAFPMVLAWRLWKAGALGDFDPYAMMLAGAAHLVLKGPSTHQERWERNAGYSPSTLAIVISALVCAADFASARGHRGIERFLYDSADFLESHVDGWTVTTQGTLVPGYPRHYIRILPVDPGEVSPNEDPNTAVSWLPDQPPGQRDMFPAKEIVDAGFLELVRYGIRRPGSDLMEESLYVIDQELRCKRLSQPCWHRYSHDTYGEHADGRPFNGWGVGRPWPLLTGERGHYELAAGRDVKPYVRALEFFAGRSGLLPEQVWDKEDMPHRGLFLGRQTGSARPLMWAHAEYIKLLRSTCQGHIFDRIDPVAVRYLDGHGRDDLEVWQFNRQVRSVRPGRTLRIQAGADFRLRWSGDSWRHYADADAMQQLGGVWFMDISISPSQAVAVQFTFFWKAGETWEGRDYAVQVAV